LESFGAIHPSVEKDLISPAILWRKRILRTNCSVSSRRREILNMVYRWKLGTIKSLDLTYATDTLKQIIVEDIWLMTK
jgi:hypothetical protein